MNVVRTQILVYHRLEEAFNKEMSQTRGQTKGGA